VPDALNGGTFAAPAVADVTRKPATDAAFVSDAIVWASVLYTSVYDGPSTIAEIGVTVYADAAEYILLAVTESVIESVYVEASDADVRVRVNTIVPVVNAPPDRPDVIAVRSVSDEGDHEPAIALLYESKGEL